MKWVKLVQRIEALESNWCEGSILNLPGWKEIGYKETSNDIIVLAELTTESIERCDCGTTWTEMTKWGFTDPTHMRDIPIRCKG